MSGTLNNPGRPTIVPAPPHREMRYVPSTADAHPWMDDAACAGWHPTAEDRHVPDEDRRMLEWIDLPPRVAKSICKECPVRRQCLDRAMKMRPLPADGIWGGLTYHEVRMLVAPIRLTVKVEDVA